MDSYVGVDVGTGSVRAALCSADGGKVLASAQRTLSANKLTGDRYEQSTGQVWRRVVHAVNDVLEQVALSNDGRRANVLAIAFDATCSLALFDAVGSPLPASTDSMPDAHGDIYNIVMWMDHRAAKQAEFINAQKHECLDMVGGAISVEMEPPKLLWLKEHNADTFNSAALLMDLTDAMAYLCTGDSAVRSKCTLVCKWCYDGRRNAWPDGFWRRIGLAEVADDDSGCARIGRPANVLPVGKCIGSGLSATAATELRLPPGTPVVAGAIDAHAGVVAALAVAAANLSALLLGAEVGDFDITKFLTMICGTSTCHMVLSREAHFVPGIWGPYSDAIFDGYYLNEAGQNAVGSLLDHLLQQELRIGADDQAQLSAAHRAAIESIARDYASSPVGLLQSIEQLHVWPDYHGNRSPLADAALTGAVCGLRLGPRDEQSVHRQYYAHVLSLAYMSRYIVDTLLEHTGHGCIGERFDAVLACGGLADNNAVYMQAHADVLGWPPLLAQCISTSCHHPCMASTSARVPIAAVDAPESCAYGAAIIASLHRRPALPLVDRLTRMGGGGTLTIYKPNGDTAHVHQRRYDVFRKFGLFVRTAKEIMH